MPHGSVQVPYLPDHEFPLIFALPEDHEDHHEDHHEPHGVTSDYEPGPASSSSPAARPPGAEQAQPARVSHHSTFFWFYSNPGSGAYYRPGVRVQPNWGSYTPRASGTFVTPGFYRGSVTRGGFGAVGSFRGGSVGA